MKRVTKRRLLERAREGWMIGMQDSYYNLVKFLDMISPDIIESSYPNLAVQISGPCFDEFSYYIIFEKIKQKDYKLLLIVNDGDYGFDIIYGHLSLKCLSLDEAVPKLTEILRKYEEKN